MEDRHSDLIGYEFVADVQRIGHVPVRVVGSWPINEQYVLCEIPGHEGTIIRPAGVVRTRKLRESA